MKAEELIKLVRTLEPSEIERFFVLLGEYESEVRRRQSSTRYIPMDEAFEKTVDHVLAENKELLQKLAEYEAQEHKAPLK